MARNTKDGKESEVTKKLLKEQEATDKAQAERDAENRAIEAAKAAAAQEESDNQTPPVAVEQPLPNKERAAAWEKFLKKYEENNPVKFAAKKARGEFDNIPDHFTGRDVLKNLNFEAMPGK